jgi:hypothetical protein
MPKGVIVTVAASDGGAGAGAGIGAGEGVGAGAGATLDGAGPPGVDPHAANVSVTARAYTRGKCIFATCNRSVPEVPEKTKSRHQGRLFCQRRADWLRRDLQMIDDAFHTLRVARNRDRLLGFSLALHRSGQRHDIGIGVNIDLQT